MNSQFQNQQQKSAGQPASQDAQRKAAPGDTAPERSAQTDKSKWESDKSDASGKSCSTSDKKSA